MVDLVPATLFILRHKTNLLWLICSPHAATHLLLPWAASVGLSQVRLITRLECKSSQQVAATLESSTKCMLHSSSPVAMVASSQAAQPEHGASAYRCGMPCAVVAAC